MPTMIESAKNIFDYQHHFNQLIAQQLLEHEGRISERSMPLFSHMINAHQIWNARIHEGQPVGVHDVRSIAENLPIDTNNYQDTLRIAEVYDPEHVVTYKNSKGAQFTNTVGEILFHISNHHTHHRAQLISDLRHIGVTPIVSDYIFYKR